MAKYNIGIKEICEYRFSVEAESKEAAISKAFDELMSGNGIEYDSSVYSKVIAVDDVPEKNPEWKVDHY